MAGSKPGPNKGSGGRPRATKHKGNQRDGYVRVTVGPKSKGTQEYEHRALMGLKNGDPRTVDHVNGEGRKKKNDSKSKLQIVSRSENVRREDESRGNRRGKSK